MVIHLVQDAATLVTGAAHWVDGLQLLQQWHLPVDLSVLDKPIQQTDLVGDIQKWFNNAMKTGQVWAFLFGLVAGYLIKTFTSFG